MSIDAVVGRIGQILAREQQLTDPASLQSPQSQAVSPPPGSGGSSSFSNALASAQASYTTSAGGVSGASGAYGAPGGVYGSGGVAGAGAGAEDPRVQSMRNMAESLIGKPYVLGGGHGSWNPSSGYDCSGFVSAVLHAGGYLSQPADTTALPSQPNMLPGPGHNVTVYDRALPGESGHVIIEIDGQFYESGGSAGPWGGGGGVQKISRPSDSYLATFPTVLHPSGL